MTVEPGWNHQGFDPYFETETMIAVTKGAGDGTYVFSMIVKLPIVDATGKDYINSSFVFSGGSDYFTSSRPNDFKIGFSENPAASGEGDFTFPPTGFTLWENNRRCIVQANISAVAAASKDEIRAIYISFPVRSFGAGSLVYSNGLVLGFY